MTARSGSYVPRDRLFLWWLAQPADPALVGELALVRSTRGVSLRYADSWVELSNDAGQYELSPAYDVLPSGQGLGYQQMRVGTDGADATLDNALSMCGQFGLKRGAAESEIQRVAAVVADWRIHFAQAGVRAGDIELIGEYVDRPFLREQREAFALRG